MRLKLIDIANESTIVEVDSVEGAKDAAQYWTDDGCYDFSGEEDVQCVEVDEDGDDVGECFYVRVQFEATN